MTDRDDVPPAQRLRQSALRVTASRVAVLGWLKESPHTSAAQIAVGVRERLGAISKQTVYDVLSAGVDAGLVRQIEPAGHPSRFELARHDNHHHLVCRSCGLVEDTACRAGGPLCLSPQDTRGFAVDEAEILYWGTCPTCRQHPGRRRTAPQQRRPVDISAGATQPAGSAVGSPEPVGPEPADDATDQDVQQPQHDAASHGLVDRPDKEQQ